MDSAAAAFYAYRFYRSRNPAMPYLRGTKSSYNNPTLYSKYISPLDYRIRKIERNVKEETPELKAYQCNGTLVCTAVNHNFLGITAQINQGVDEYQRLGNAIKVKGIKITCTKNDPFLCAFLTYCPNGIAPTPAVFTASSVCQVMISETDDFKILHYFHNYGDTAQVVQYNRRFKKPIHTRYRAGGGATETQGALYLCLWNSSSTNFTFDYTITVYFTDA